MEDTDLFDMAALRQELNVSQHRDQELASTSPQDITPEAPVREQAEEKLSAPRTPYTRQRPPRRTQEAIDDLAEDDNPIEYAHESNVAVGGVLGDRSYRRARSEISQFQKNNRYGQYLEIPKGRRSIFAKRERSRRRQAALAAIVVVGVLALVAYIVYLIMGRISLG